jgi:mannose-6-phosphate isomerase-like protein (cupin superfamily)
VPPSSSRFPTAPANRRHRRRRGNPISRCLRNFFRRKDFLAIRSWWAALPQASYPAGGPPTSAGRTTMRRDSLRFGRGFRGLDRQWLRPGRPEGDCAGRTRGRAHNRHRGRDQWLIVVSGIGQAIINGKRYPLRAGSLILIEPGERHEICSTGRAPISRRCNIRLPPGYSQSGQELARARPRKGPTITAAEVDQVATRLQEPR